jgi:hypothetical protein
MTFPVQTRRLYKAQEATAYRVVRRKRTKLFALPYLIFVRSIDQARAKKHHIAAISLLVVKTPCYPLSLNCNIPPNFNNKDAP